MKLFIVLLLFILPIQWEPNFDTAKIRAKEKQQLILLNFSGSDWCGPCILFRKEYLESEAFTQMANDNLVLVNADFPRKKKNIPTPAIVQQNDGLAEKYNKKGVFPLTLLLNAEGKVLKTWEGKPEESLTEWIAEVKSVCDKNK
jgi:thiol-disulfide isomerase/thioredoxin